MGLENIPKKECTDKVNALAHFYADNKENEESIRNAGIEYFESKYSSMIEQGKPRNVSRVHSMDETMDYMVRFVNKMYEHQ